MRFKKIKFKKVKLNNIEYFKRWLFLEFWMFQAD